MWRRHGTACGVALLLALGIAGTAGAQGARLKFATLSQGTAWYQYGATIAELLGRSMPGATIDVLPHSGGTGNVRLVARGEAQLGLGFGASNRWFIERKELYEKDRGTQRLRAIAGGLDIYYLAVIASKKLPIATLAEIKEKRIPIRLMTLSVGSLSEYGMRHLLAAHGMTYDDIRSWGGKLSFTTYKIIVDAMRDDQADMLIAVVNPGHPSITELATFGDVRFLPLQAKVLDELAVLGYEKGLMPANTYKGQDQALPYPATTTVIITRDDLPAELAYTTAKTLAENREALGNANAALRLFNPEVAWRPEKVGGVPLHPGAERFYRERGWMR